MFSKYKKQIITVTLIIIAGIITYYILFSIIELFQTAKSFQKNASPVNQNENNLTRSHNNYENNFSSPSEQNSRFSTGVENFIIFYNFECPLCRSAFNDILRILKTSPGYQNNYFHVPDASSGNMISKASLCAADQKKLPEFLRIIFSDYQKKARNSIYEKENMIKNKFSGWKSIFTQKRKSPGPEQRQSNDNKLNDSANTQITMRDIMNYALSAGIDRKTFSACLNSPEAEQQIKERNEMIQKKNIRELPALYRDPELFTGQKAFEKFKTEF